MLSEINEATAVVSLGLSFSTHKLEETFNSQLPVTVLFRLPLCKIQDLCAALAKLT